MRTTSLDSATEVEHVVRNLLRESKAWGRFPTPVDKIVNFGELSIAQHVDLSKADEGFLPRQFGFLSSALKKVLGLIDFRQRTIYLDQTVSASRQNFIKLHEVGHGVLPWQRQLREGYGDDALTLDPEIDEQFEREANHFASAALFQLDHFEHEMMRLPLTFSAVRALSKKFGASIQATARRYVAACPKRCALIVLHKPSAGEGPFSVAVRNCFESPTFVADFGQLAIPPLCDHGFRFVQDIQRKRRMHEDGVITLATDRSPSLALDYHFFNNPYNSFVFLFPHGETISSRATIVERPNR